MKEEEYMEEEEEECMEEEEEYMEEEEECMEEEEEDEEIKSSVSPLDNVDSDEEEEDEPIESSVSPLDNVDSDDDSVVSRCDLFCFHVVATITDVDDDSNVFVEIREDKFKVERSNGEASRASIRKMLKSLDVSRQTPLIDNIINDSRSVASRERVQGHKVIHVRLAIDVSYIPEELECEWVNDYPEGDNGDSDPVEDMESFTDFDHDELRINFVPAKKSSLEGLERVNVEKCNIQCTICMEEMFVGSEATRLPCSHLYHGPCVFNWLEKSGVCPLCRFVIV